MMSKIFIQVSLIFMSLTAITVSADDHGEKLPTVQLHGPKHGRSGKLTLSFQADSQLGRRLVDAFRLSSEVEVEVTEGFRGFVAYRADPVSVSAHGRYPDYQAKLEVELDPKLDVLDMSAGYSARMKISLSGEGAAKKLYEVVRATTSPFPDIRPQAFDLYDDERLGNSLSCMLYNGEYSCSIYLYGEVF